MTVNNNVVPDVSITANPSGAICAGSSVTFSAAPTYGGSNPSYQWYVGTTQVGTNSDTYIYTPANGDAVNCVMTSDIACATGGPVTSNIITEQVNPYLSAGVTLSASPSGAVCQGSAVTFTATATNGGTSPSYQWMVGSTQVGTNSSTYSYIPVNADAVSCVMTSNYACLTGSASVSDNLTMQVNTILAASVTIASNPGSTICAGTGVTFTATPVNGGASPSYQWFNNGTLITGQTNSTYSSYALANNDAITCEMTSNLLCSSGSPATSNSITITITTISTNATATPSTICAGSCSTLNATGGTYFTWDNGNTTPMQIVCPPTTTTYTVSVTTSNGCTGSATVTVYVNPLPAVPTITQIVGDLQSSPASTYQWYLNGGIINGATSQTYTPLQNGNYTVVVTDVNGCSATSAAFNVTWVGITETGNADYMHIFPNPASDVITVEIPSLTNSKMIAIYNVEGQLILQQPMLQAKTEINISGLATGIYVLKLYSDEKTRVTRFVKE